MTKGKGSAMKRKASSRNDSNSGTKRQKTNEESKIESSKLFSEEALANLKIYNELKTEYEEEGVNQITHQFLNRISHKKLSENPNLSKTPLMQYMSNACKIIMLNEFEISAWAVWLDEINLEGDKDYTVEDKIMCTAFYIKIFLNDEPGYNAMYQTYFN
jgi:hypothetical protein